MSVKDFKEWKRRIILDIKVPIEEISKLFNYLIEILEKNSRISYISKSSINGNEVLQYRMNIDGRILDIAIKATNEGFEIYYFPYPEESISEKEYRILDLEIEEMIRSYFKEGPSLFLVFSPKMDILPKEKEKTIKKIIGSIIFGNFLYLFMIILLFGIIIYQFFEMLTPLILIALQFTIIIFAHKIITYRGEFNITPDNPTIYITELKMNKEEFNRIIRIHYPKIKIIKKEIYDSTLALGKNLNPEVLCSIFNKYGITCKPELIKIKAVNVYEIIERLSSKFKFNKIPKITLVNVLPPNAAATGISYSKSAILITSGLIAYMDKEEIEAVLAHELSHIKARDPIVLMSLATFEYLTRVYIIWPFISRFGLLFDILYLFFAFTLLFFVAKFLEARADLDAAIITGNPRALASSLRKIGLIKYQSLAFELVNVSDWLKWDPHPPLYHRIKVLNELDISKIKNTMTYAISSCINAFIKSLKEI
ncbi:MAG: M48 family metalloprotease [Candidatus Methanomethylicaceae archaeon]|nr:M48 family metalloprotease [Candidatus Verstraetearchaeota archaeon]